MRNAIPWVGLIACVVLAMVLFFLFRVETRIGTGDPKGTLAFISGIGALLAASATILITRLISASPARAIRRIALPVGTLTAGIGVVLIIGDPGDWPLFISTLPVGLSVMFVGLEARFPDRELH